MSARYLSTDQARAFYDRFGAHQDAQAFYEDAALDVLVREGGFDSCRSVLEIGCGTGRLAERLLTREMPQAARYAGCDISATMIGLARERLARFGPRALLWQGDGSPDFAPADPPVDRIVSAYVMDLLPDQQIAAMLRAAAGALVPGGRLCLVGLTRGTGPFSGITSRAWGLIARLRPQLVGGCRPISLLPRLDAGQWHIRHRSVVVRWTIPSEIVIAERRDGGAHA